MDNIIIDIYQTKTGKEPYITWEESLDKSTLAIIQSRLARIRRGNLGDVTAIKGSSSIFEIRFDFGPGYRIYYGKIKSNFIVLLNAGNKRTQSKDIEKAKLYWIDYKEQK